ncbi:hypothetical protein FACS18949_12240 [Clostridia bacterium]|nr:hypothetical protein FACS18949_12240 [Clostridia bacterium]
MTLDTQQLSIQEAFFDWADQRLKNMFNDDTSPPRSSLEFLNRTRDRCGCRIKTTEGELLDDEQPYSILETSREPRKFKVMTNVNCTGWSDHEQSELWYGEIAGYILLDFLEYDREHTSPYIKYQQNAVQYFSEKLAAFIEEARSV